MPLTMQSIPHHNRDGDCFLKRLLLFSLSYIRTQYTNAHFSEQNSFSILVSGGVMDAGRGGETEMHASTARVA